MFLSTSATTHPTPKGLNPRRKLGTFASAARATLIQARRIRAGHVTFVLGLTLAVTAAVSFGAFESGASRARTHDGGQATRTIALPKAAAPPPYIVIFDSQEEDHLFLAESYHLFLAESYHLFLAESHHLQTESLGSVRFPTVRVISSPSEEEQLQDELSTMFYSGVAYRLTDLRTK